MSCLTTSATRRSRIVSAAVCTACAAASSHEVPLVPMTSITLYTLMRASSLDQPDHPCLGRSADGRAIDPPARFSATSTTDLIVVPGHLMRSVVDVALKRAGG